MSLDYFTLEALRQNHPAWRLMCADQAPLVVSFLHRVFIVPNERFISQSDLAEALDDELFGLKERLGTDAFKKTALEYLNDWSHNDKGWLRKFYREGSDEPQFDLTPATEKAITWLGSLIERSFVGTESRLLTLFELLKQISEGSEQDPYVRIGELVKRKDEIEAEIAHILATENVPVLESTSVKDRFLQFMALARELLTDFREVEQNFRDLDRRTREKIARWDGAKGSLLEEIMGERDSIGSSDQGKSFQAFWDFLMSTRRQEELTQLLDRALSLPPVQELHPDPRLRRVHYDWLEAGEHTQRTVAVLSQQLRRFIDDTAWLENRRIIEILHSVEANALALRETVPAQDIMEIAGLSADIELPFERPLFTPTTKLKIRDVPIEADESDIDASALFDQIVIDKAELARYIRQCLQERPQIALSDLLRERPLKHGLAELIAYLHLASDNTFDTVVDEQTMESVVWENSSGRIKRAQFARVLFVR